MAHPKRRQSKTRTAKRRTHDVLWLQLLHAAATAAHGMFITLFAPSAVTIVARRCLTMRLLYNDNVLVSLSIR